MKTLPALLSTFVVAALPGTAATLYTGNGNTGFGGEIGNGTLSLDDDGTTITATLTKGADPMTDAFVIYIDSVAGGFVDTSTISDDGDELRRAASGFDGGAGNTSTVAFPAGFGADYVISMDADGPNFGGLWSMASGGAFSLPFIDTVNLSPTGTSVSATYTFSFDLSEIGLSTGDSFNFVATYLNGNGVFRSDEAFGDGIASGNPGFDTVTFTDSLTYNSIPAPSVGLLSLLGALGLLRRRR